MTRLSTSRRMSSAQLAVVLREAINRVNRRLRKTRPIADVTIAQISALQSMSLAGVLTPRELADAERVQPPTMTKIIARLDERGLIVRRPHATDGRQVILSLSAEGQRLIEEYGRIRDEWLAQRLAKLTAEEREIVAQAAEIMNRIARD